MLRWFKRGLREKYGKGIKEGDRRKERGGREAKQRVVIKNEVQLSWKKCSGFTQ